MDPFAVIMLGGLAGLIVVLVLLGRYHPRSGADVLDWRPTRSVETEVFNEFQDVEQMLEAKNARRRARGLPEIAEEDYRAQIARELPGA